MHLNRLIKVWKGFFNCLAEIILVNLIKLFERLWHKHRITFFRQPGILINVTHFFTIYYLLRLWLLHPLLNFPDIRPIPLILEIVPIVHIVKWPIGTKKNCSLQPSIRYNRVRYNRVSLYMNFITYVL